MKILRIATRKSPLALWQTEHVAERLRVAYPDLQIELVPLSTRGDEQLDRSLAAIGGKGLFLKELELAMERGEADCAVHSLKDVPMELEPGFRLPAILQRADSADAFISNHFDDIAALPEGAHVGTSSLRRRAQLLKLRPDLRVSDLRGNVNTRLAKLDEGQYDAIILACAGLLRLGMADRIRSRLDAPDWLPAPAQGAIAIECADNADDIARLVAVLDDATTRICVEAERAANRALGGSCHLPIAALATLNGENLHIAGLVGDAATGRCVRAQTSGAASGADALGKAVAASLLEAGAGQFIA
ncbi:hydroxymethylbilane synthase [Lysobacter soyae]|uniref:Porphobilinogen deaminase n=1 Tax=Lysobacter soyae TaxID=2764185 RepID=A0ABX8WR72_9GAMM|nr:hydroxymethylbilane synthase [Lysobacter sp. CJ11]QYR53327.1 hydroxymethylbilane synthase [Lysobacter sp. CJ11]